MQTYFWLDEDNPGAINLFQLVRNPGKTNASDDTAVRYNDNDDWPAHAPVGMYFKYGLVDQFMREWLLRKEELKAGSITRSEYFEWKLNWPQTCDDCGKHTFPCKLIKNLEKSYNQRYGASLMENSLFVKEYGLTSFIQQQLERYTCPSCGGVISLHDAECSKCQTKTK